MQHAVKQDNAELSLLLVEDEAPARASLRRMLSLKFPELVIHTAENGLAGLELYRECLPELVITDIRMPKLDGIEMAKAIREISPQAQIIVLSAHSDSRYRDNAAGTGVSRYLLKPVDGRELFDAVERCLERSEEIRRF
jgi:two-component system, sensor histidine kinase and response regulator